MVGREIKERVREVKALFDDDVIEERRQFRTLLWKGERVRRPAFQVIAEAFAEDSGCQPTEKELHDRPDVDLLQQLNHIEKRARYSGDYIPLLIPYPSTVVIASAFGCEVVWADERTSPWVKPAIHEASEIPHLKKPGLSGGLVQEALNGVRYFTEASDGCFPLRSINYQGPFTNAAEVMGDQKFLVELFDHPEEVHMLLDMVTDSMIEFVKKEMEIAGNLIPTIIYPDWIPENYGIGIADDWLAAVSPAVYEEFAIPYNNRLSEAFNGIHIHSCGNYAHNYDTVLKHRNLRGVNFEASDNDLRTVFSRFGGKVVIAPHAGLHTAEAFGDIAGYLKELLKYWNESVSLELVIEKGYFDPRTGTYRHDGFEEAVSILDGLRGSADSA